MDVEVIEMIRRKFLFALLALAVANSAALNALRAQDSIFENKKIVPYVPSPQFVVDKMIELAGVKPGDLVYDLGSGDGRIVITAAKMGAKAVGFEIDGDLVGESRANIKKAGVEANAEIRNQDILTVDFSDATVVTALEFCGNLNSRTIDLLVRERPVVSQSACRRAQSQRSTRLQIYFICPLELEFYVSGVSAGGNREIIFELLWVAVEG